MKDQDHDQIEMLLTEILVRLTSIESLLIDKNIILEEDYVNKLKELSNSVINAMKLEFEKKSHN